MINVFYLYSTSNHNQQMVSKDEVELYSISILHQTTTLYVGSDSKRSLYSISILHQTTTHKEYWLHKKALYSISILHQTTTNWGSTHPSYYCILSVFYIKPQLYWGFELPKRIVFYQYSTSNHNFYDFIPSRDVIVFYQYSTSNHNTTSRFNSKVEIVFYQYSTSNHNPFRWSPLPIVLYSISILHQTTTRRGVPRHCWQLYSISILHQTTTV